MLINARASVRPMMACSLRRLMHMASLLLSLGVFTATSACGSTSTKSIPGDSGPFNQVGVLTSSSGPQCTATVLNSTSRVIIATAAHCVKGYTDFRFAPGHDGDNPLFSADMDSAGTRPLGVWRIARPPYYDQENDLAFLIVDRRNGKRIEDAVGGGWSLSANSPAGAGWTAYGYDVNWASTDGQGCPAPGGTPLCKTPYEPPHHHLHLCKQAVQKSSVNAGSVVMASCPFGDFASGGPWIDGSYHVGAIDHGEEFDTTTQGYGALLVVWG